MILLFGNLCFIAVIPRGVAETILPAAGGQQPCSVYGSSQVYAALDFLDNLRYHSPFWSEDFLLTQSFQLWLRRSPRLYCL